MLVQQLKTFLVNLVTIATLPVENKEDIYVTYIGRAIIPETEDLACQSVCYIF